MDVEVGVDPQRCQGHGTCYGHRPDLFTADEEGFAQVLVTDLTASDLAEALARAADACPEQAIVVSP